MRDLSRQIFYMLLVRPALLILLGFNIRHLDRLNADRPQLVAANHNSHLDALVLMSLFPWRQIPKIRLVAAREYWCRTKWMAWFSRNLIGVIPIDRQIERGSDPYTPILEALDRQYTLIIFPEGSRGEPEQRQPLKNGIAKVLEARPQITVTPVFMHGLGKALPRGEGLLVPFICEINVGEALTWQGNRRGVVVALDAAFEALADEIAPKPWA